MNSSASAEGSGTARLDGSAVPVGRLSGRSIAVIAAYGLTLLLVNFGRPWALTFHEVNFAGPAREFLRTGDWLVPRIMGQPLWDKPPLMHWSIAASMLALGTEAEWAARLPATLSAVATALVVAGLAARWHGERVGLLAGLVQSTAVYVMMQGRLAEADMMLCAVVAGAMACFAVAAVGRGDGRPPRARILGFFGLAGLAFLVKGPIGPALIAAGVGLFAIVERRRGPWRLLLDPLGWALMLALILAWPLAAMLREPGLLDVWWRHNVERFSGELGGGARDPFFYLYTGLWLALPWTPLAILGVVAGLRSRRVPPGAWRLLACWLAGGLLLLSLSAWKHKHYIIPSLPPLSIWAACGLARLAFAPAAPPTSRARRRIRAGLRGALGVVGVGGMVAGAWFLRRGEGPAAAVGLVAGLAGTGLAVAGMLLRRGRPGAALAGVFGAIWAAFVLVQSLAMPRFDDYRGQADLARRLADRLPGGADLSVVTIPDPQVTYYLPLPLRHHEDCCELAERLVDAPAPAGVGPIYVVGPRLILEPLGRLGEVRVLDRAGTVHPRKGEPDRMIAAEVRPDPRRLALAASGRDPALLRCCGPAADPRPARAQDAAAVRKTPTQPSTAATSSARSAGNGSG